MFTINQKLDIESKDSPLSFIVSYVNSMSRNLRHPAYQYKLAEVCALRPRNLGTEEKN